MIKVLTIICLCASLSVVFPQCSNTANLRTLYGFGNTVTTAATQSGLKYCKSLQNSPVCCTASDINSIQSKNDALATTLLSSVATRDKYFKQINNNILGQLQTATTNFAKTVASFTTYASTPSSDPNVQASNQELLEELTGISGSFSVLAANYPVELATVTTNLNAFQSARTTCVVEMLKLQDSAFCLSCDPNAATKGYNPTTGNFTLGTNTCNRLKQSCYPFVSQSLFQGAPISLAEWIDQMNHYSAVATKAQSGQALTAADLDYVPTNPPDASPPDSCTTQANCDWICTSLFGSNGVINQAELVAGGEVSTFSRLLEENENDRQLQSGSFDPSDDEAGTTVTFQNDPGNTNTPSKSAMLSFGSVLLGAIMLLSSYLL